MGMKMIDSLGKSSTSNGKKPASVKESGAVIFRCKHHKLVECLKSKLCGFSADDSRVESNSNDAHAPLKKWAELFNASSSASSREVSPKPQEASTETRDSPIRISWEELADMDSDAITEYEAEYEQDHEKDAELQYSEFESVVGRKKNTEAVSMELIYENKGMKVSQSAQSQKINYLESKLVGVNVGRQCRPMCEEVLKPIIANNYYTDDPHSENNSNDTHAPSKKCAELFKASSSASSYEVIQKPQEVGTEIANNASVAVYSTNDALVVLNNADDSSVENNSNDAHAPLKKWAELFNASSSASSREVSPKPQEASTETRDSPIRISWEELADMDSDAITEYEADYDGRKRAYTAGPLPFASKDFVVKLEDSRRDMEFKLSTKFASKADLHLIEEFLNSTNEFETAGYGQRSINPKAWDASEGTEITLGRSYVSGVLNSTKDATSVVSNCINDVSVITNNINDALVVVNNADDLENNPNDTHAPSKKWAELFKALSSASSHKVIHKPQEACMKICDSPIRMGWEELADMDYDAITEYEADYDGRKRAYTAGPLPFASKDFVVKLEDSRRDIEFKISTKFASNADLHLIEEFFNSTNEFESVVGRKKNTEAVLGCESEPSHEHYFQPSLQLGVAATNIYSECKYCGGYCGGYCSFTSISAVIKLVYKVINGVVQLVEEEIHMCADGKGTICTAGVKDRYGICKIHKVLRSGAFLGISGTFEAQIMLLQRLREYDDRGVSSIEDLALHIRRLLRAPDLHLLLPQTTLILAGKGTELRLKLVTIRKVTKFVGTTREVIETSHSYEEKFARAGSGARFMFPPEDYVFDVEDGALNYVLDQVTVGCYNDIKPSYRETYFTGGDFRVIRITATTMRVGIQRWIAGEGPVTEWEDFRWFPTSPITAPFSLGMWGTDDY